MTSSNCHAAPSIDLCLPLFMCISSFIDRPSVSFVYFCFHPIWVIDVFFSFAFQSTAPCRFLKEKKYIYLKIKFFFHASSLCIISFPKLKSTHKQIVETLQTCAHLIAISVVTYDFVKKNATKHVIVYQEINSCAPSWSTPTVSENIEFCINVCTGKYAWNALNSTRLDKLQ